MARYERVERPHELRRIVPVREVAGVLENRKMCVGHLAVDALALVGGQDPIALSPQDQGREVFDHLDPVERAHPLTFVVDD
jgi:hypothetical protein